MRLSRRPGDQRQDYKQHPTQNICEFRAAVTAAGIMMEPNCPPMARVAAAKVLLDRGWGKPKEMHHSEVDDNKTQVVNEIVHVHETREQISRASNDLVENSRSRFWS